jgi:hypothetical protein
MQTMTKMTFGMYCVWLLVNARTLDEFDSILEDVATCLLNERQNNDMLESFSKLRQMIHRMEERGEVFEAEETNLDHEDDEKEVDGKKSRVDIHRNPFHNHYAKLIATFKKRASDNNKNEMSDEETSGEEMSEGYKPNQSFCPQFFAIIESYLPEMPLWSGVLLGSLDRYIDGSLAEYDNLDDYPYLSFKSANARTEGYIEGMMRNLKQEDFPGRRRMRVDAFVLENYPRIRRRLNDFSDRVVSRKTKKQKNRANKSKKDKRSSENVEIPDADNNLDASDRKATQGDTVTEVCSDTGPLEDVHTSNESFASRSKDVKPSYKESLEHTRTEDNVSFDGAKNRTKETSVDVDGYSNAQETWGKRDAATPKRNPKVNFNSFHRFRSAKNLTRRRKRKVDIHRRFSNFCIRVRKRIGRKEDANTLLGKRGW